MTSDLTRYAKAAQALPMAWLTQSDFPSKDLVKSSFREALNELPASNLYQDNLVRAAGESVVSGVDPRSGTFKAQAIHAAAKLHDRVTELALAPKPKKVRRNSVLHGYCGGSFGESYGHKLVTEKGDGWINYKFLDGPCRVQQTATTATSRNWPNTWCPITTAATTARWSTDESE